jgi:Bacterial pre-peptidase C-terminal domain
MKSRLVGVLALTAAGWLAAVVARPDTRVLMPVPEVEPNNTPATANPLDLTGGCQAASGAISPATDLDYYSFTAAPGAKLWALVDAGAGDSILTLYGPDGTTVLEVDDDDAPGNTCDATVEAFHSSAIAGHTLTAGGTYFLRVGSFGPSTISAYKLFVTVTTGSTAESEPNDTAATANPLVTSSSLIGVRTAAIGTAGDADYYSVTVNAPATFFIDVDGDPNRVSLTGGMGTDIVVDLIAPDGTTVLFTADNSIDGTTTPPPPAESFCFNIAPGTYFVRVTGFSQGKLPVTGPYSIMVAACGLPPVPTPTPTVTTVVGGPTATPTPTRTSTPQGGIAPSDIPTLSFPMLLLMGLALIASAFVLVRRL